LLSITPTAEKIRANTTGRAILQIGETMPQDHLQNDHSPSQTPPSSPLSVGMLLYPGFTLIDLAGPQTAFGFVGKTHLLWKTMDPVPTDMGVTMNPTATFDNAPENLDVLFVPGGFGTAEIMADQETISFLEKAGSTARYVTSVCTGSVLLGMAGLLEGYRASTHWEFYEPLKALGVEASYERVTVDRNRITGGGATAGIDFALVVIANLLGRATAELVQLGLEYDPQPAFNSGHPRSASPDAIAGVKSLMAHMQKPGLDLATASRQRRVLASTEPGRA
jgi:cyclohexyl-isocyanide hydratase